MHKIDCSDELLPSPQSLRRSSLAALAVAVLLLLTTVLPAEYAIDPTGVGRALGLTRMGELKQDPGRAASQPAAPAVQPAAPAAAPARAGVETIAGGVPLQRHEISLLLQPDEATEIKLEMPMGARVQYQWSANGGRLNYDTHGDPHGAAAAESHSYGKGQQSPAQQGELVAAFDGRHGWYWRNRSSQPVRLTLRTEGEYVSIEQVL